MLGMFVLGLLILVVTMLVSFAVRASPAVFRPCLRAFLRR